MNVSHPPSSSIERVDFGILSSDEVKKLSVKQITNPKAVDDAHLPIPGGLYDPALGGFKDQACTTCTLSPRMCPGHCGHIVLPAKVYHCAFINQIFTLVRAQCIHCQRLRLSRPTVHRYSCKLRLIRAGLLKEAAELEEKTAPKAQLLDSDAKDDDSDNPSDDTDTEIARQEAYVKKCFKIAKRHGTITTTSQEPISEARQALIRAFYADIRAKKPCAKCKGMTPSYRKNGATLIFRKPFNPKEMKINMELGLKDIANPLIEFREAKKKRELKKQQRKSERARLAEDIDEGVADMESSSDGDIGDLHDIEVQDEIPELEDTADAMEEDSNDSEASGDVIRKEASTKKKRNKGQKQSEQSGEKYLVPDEIYAIISNLFDCEREIFSLIYDTSLPNENPVAPSADMFFITHLLVTPYKFRKESNIGGDDFTEAEDNTSYSRILTTGQQLDDIQKELNGLAPQSMARPRTVDDLKRAWMNLQDMVNAHFDRDKYPTRGPDLLRQPSGVKQKLEHKEGLMRMNMMGKRVNFAARTVISPDPNIETNEVGVPPVFAKKLTYPEPVTTYSLPELKQAVINGPNKWPGAVAVEYENGQVINLKRKTDDERQAIANLLLAPSNSMMNGSKNKKVYRHLNNGDIVIMNRQPTLHKPSMMCHKVRVLPGEKTLRIHYANGNTYNADFDGDEMNMHFPQNELARSEALQIADTDHQYLSSTAGQPLRGLIQDHISMSVWLTCADTMFDREEYHDLLYSSLRPENGDVQSDRIRMVPPTIIIPRKMWTGKQLIDTILLNITPDSHQPLNLTSKPQIDASMWGELSHDGIVRVENGELLTGILDKKQIGSSAGGLIHTIYEAFGPTAAGKFISVLSRLLTRLLNTRAFSCGVQDILLSQKGEITRKEKLEAAKTVGLSVASKYVSLEEEAPASNDPELLSRLEMVLRDDQKQAGLDALMNNRTKDISSEVTMACLPDGLEKGFPKNQMQTMTVSGAKGSKVNANQISCNLGQQVLEGRRVPSMISGKTLPCFKPFESNVRAGGYIVDRFLTGIRPQEYYFHTMAGREGLIDTAVKTSRSGYLQRCIVKGLEGLRVAYDSSVRDSDGTIIQTLYGEDGLDVAKQKSIRDFKFMASNFYSLYASLNVRQELPYAMSKEAQEWNKKASKKFSKTDRLDAKDPALSKFPPATHAGSTSESFYQEYRDYIEKNPDDIIRQSVDLEEKNFKVKKKGFIDLMNLKYLKSVIESGEAVGVITGQSLGEPSTQMTLNTFHLAGHSAKNVTLGIPRLREIVMTASKNIKTPTMKIYPIPELGPEQMQLLAKGLSRRSLAEIIDQITVSTRLGEGAHSDARFYDIRLDFFPAEEYTKEYGIQVQDVIETIHMKFLSELRKMIRAEKKKRGKEKSAKRVSDAVPEVGKSSGRLRENNAGGGGENPDGGDSDADPDDASYAKQRDNQAEGGNFDEPDRDEEEILRREGTPVEDSESEGENENGKGVAESSREASPELSESEQRARNVTGVSKVQAKDRKARIQQNFHEISDFAFDDKDGGWCTMSFEYSSSTAKLLLLPLAIRAAHRALVQHVPLIKSCTLATEKHPTLKDSNGDAVDVPVVLTEGVNLVAMHEYQDTIDPHRIATNDVGAMLLTYGVEAARATIIRELRAVFEGHSIAVDYRHLALVADYMTRGGDYQAFNRMGMRDKTSAFGRMSFESPYQVLGDAVIEGQGDALVNPSARICTGRLGNMGTGMFDVLMPVVGQEDEDVKMEEADQMDLDFD